MARRSNCARNPRAGRTRAARQALIAAASAELVARDLGTIDAPSRDLAGFLRVLASPVKSVDMRVYGDGTPLFGFAGATTRAGAVVARVGDELRIGPVTLGGLAGPLLASLTPLPAGPERPANVGVADFERACAAGSSDGFQRVLRDAGLREDEVATVTRAVASRHGGGQLGVTGAGAYCSAGWTRRRGAMCCGATGPGSRSRRWTCRG